MVAAHLGGRKDAKEGSRVIRKQFCFLRKFPKIMLFLTSISLAGTVSYGDPNRGGGVLDTDFYSL